MSTTLRAIPTRVQTTIISLPRSSYKACTWAGHCLGDPCNYNDDCDQDWICVSHVCSPCCGGPSSISSIAVTTTIASTSAITASSITANGSHTLNTVSAIGVGIAIVAFLSLGIGIGVWVWCIRRRKRTGVQAPANSARQGLQANTVENYCEYEIKRLAGTQRQELEDRRKPTFTHHNPFPSLTIEHDVVLSEALML